MSQSLQPSTRAVTAAEVDASWIATVAEIIRRDGHEVRAGGADRIECRSIIEPRTWGVLSPRFINAEERDKVLAQITPAAAPVEFIHASGEAICPDCQKPYWRHPHSEHKAYDGYPWLRRLCNGTLVKL